MRMAESEEGADYGDFLSSASLDEQFRILRIEWSTGSTTRLSSRNLVKKGWLKCGSNGTAGWTELGVGRNCESNGTAGQAELQVGRNCRSNGTADRTKLWFGLNKGRTDLRVWQNWGGMELRSNGTTGPTRELWVERNCGSDWTTDRTELRVGRNCGSDGTAGRTELRVRRWLSGIDSRSTREHVADSIPACVKHPPLAQGSIPATTAVIPYPITTCYRFPQQQLSGRIVFKTKFNFLNIRKKV